MKKWMRTLFRFRLTAAMLLGMQAALSVTAVTALAGKFRWLCLPLNLTSLLAVLHIIKKPQKSAYRLMWIAMISLFPVSGGVFYWLWDFRPDLHRSRKREAELCAEPRRTEPETLSGQSRLLSDYLSRQGYPLRNGTAEYFRTGEELFPALLDALERAERYIFLEYFIIEEGTMWNRILGILRRKAEEGLEVRVLYDDVGCMFLLPRDYPETLEKMGIRCRVFHPFRAVLTPLINYRDHRKIVSVDGKTAFTGGVNLADEYINAVEKHGRWKDSAVEVTEGAAWGLTELFLRMWELSSGQSEPRQTYRPGDWSDSAGLLQPYGDSPVLQDGIGEQVYLRLISAAERELLIQTPYLIPSEEILNALKMAAKSGVQVRIAVPGHWDKYLVHLTTRSYYRELLEAGVEILEYAPGFLHAKTFVCDGKTAAVGTANLDYRSLCLHYECGVCIYEPETVEKVREDFERMLPECKRISPQDCRGGFFLHLLQQVLRLFAPFL